MRKHYVEFYSPGTLCSESSMRPIDSWNTVQAVEMANGIQERHGAKPYGFRFLTRLELPPVDDGEGGAMTVTPKEVATSGIHFLGGELLKFEDVPDTSENSILRSNMRGNDYAFVLVNRNSYKSCTKFSSDDCVVDASGTITKRGTDFDVVDYRARFKEECEAYWTAKRKEYAAK